MLGLEYGTTEERRLGQIAKCRVGLGEGVAHHAGRDLARNGELAHLHQIRVRTDVHAFDSSFAGDDVRERGIDAAADTDGEIGTTECQRFDAEFGRGIQTDEVETGTRSVG